MSINEEIETIAKKTKPIYLITGTNDYFENEIRKQIKKLIPKEDQMMNYAEYDMDNTSLATALDDALSVPFFGDRRVVIIKNAMFLTGSNPKGKLKHNPDELVSYLEHVPVETVLFIFVPAEKLDGRKNVVKKLKQKSTLLELESVSEQEISKIVKDKVASSGYQIETDALNELFSRTLGDLALIINELDKVFIYCKDSKVIEKDTIDKLVSKSLDQNVFGLVDDVVSGRVTKAIQFYGQLLEQKQEPIQINAILESQFRLLLQVKILAQHSYSPSMMTKELKVHPYRIKLANQSAKRFTIDYLQAAYLELVEIESKLKSSTDDPELLFEIFAIKFNNKKNSV